MELPLVSIIVVSYNHSQFLVECLDSIKNQTYNHWELIVADDASLDNSVDVIKKWLSDNNITAKTNFHTKNTGLATTLNECVELCKGKYVKLLAADDYLHAENFEKCVGKLEELGEDYGMVCTNVYTVNHRSKRVEDFLDYDALNVSINKDFFNETLIKVNTIAALSVMMRAKTLLQTGQYLDKFLCEDYFRWLKINEISDIEFINERLAYYRKHDNNISSHKIKKIEKEEIILKTMFDKRGVERKKINSKILLWYLNRELDKELIAAYLNYKYRSRKLSLAIKSNLFIFPLKILQKTGLFKFF